MVDEWELHEYSQVAVGMNKEATTLALKGIDPLPKLDLSKLVFKIKSNSDDDAATCTKRAHEATQDACKEEAAKDDHLKAAKAHKEAAKAHRKDDNEEVAKHHDAAAKAHEAMAKSLDDEEAINKDDMEAAKTHSAKANGLFTAATSGKSNDIKSGKAPHMLAHKGIHAFHKEMMDDLKEAAKDDGLMDKGINTCAKEALEDFADNAKPHVEKYIKAVREMGKDDVLPALEGTEEPERKGGKSFDDFEEKDYSAPHREMHKVRDEMIKAIHAHKGNKSVVPEHEAKVILTKHHEDALPHAKAFIKAWRESHSADTSRKPTLRPQWRRC